MEKWDNFSIESSTFCKNLMKMMLVAAKSDIVEARSYKIQWDILRKWNEWTTVNNSATIEKTFAVTAEANIDIDWKYFQCSFSSLPLVLFCLLSMDNWTKAETLPLLCGISVAIEHCYCSLQFTEFRYTNSHGIRFSARNAIYWTTRFFVKSQFNSQNTDHWQMAL